MPKCFLKTIPVTNNAGNDKMYVSIQFCAWGWEPELDWIGIGLLEEIVASDDVYTVQKVFCKWAFMVLEQFVNVVSHCYSLSGIIFTYSLFKCNAVQCFWSEVGGGLSGLFLFRPAIMYRKHLPFYWTSEYLHMHYDVSEFWNKSNIHESLRKSNAHKFSILMTPWGVTPM